MCPKVRLHRLLVENFRGIHHADINFEQIGAENDSILVLGGPNGSGKTSILEAALLAVNADHLVSRPNPGSENSVRAGADDFLIEAAFTTWEQRVNIKRTLKHRYPDVKELRDLVPVAYFSSWRAPRHVGGVPITAGKKGRQPDRRNEENRFLLIKQLLVNSRAHSLLRGATGKPPSGAVSYTDVVQRLSNVWQRFHPSSGSYFAVDEVGEDPESGFDLFLINPNGHRISVDALSSGEQELLGFFGWFISQRLDGALIVIDEPELHLDPQWHRPLLHAMRDVLPNSQFLVATHSPEIFNSVYSFQRLFLVPKDDPRAKLWHAQAGEQGAGQEGAA